MESLTDTTALWLGVDVDVGGRAPGSRKIAGKPAQVAQDAGKTAQLSEWWGSGGNHPADDIFTEGGEWWVRGGARHWASPLQGK
jgi:hypothetical protein